MVATCCRVITTMIHSFTNWKITKCYDLLVDAHNGDSLAFKKL